MLPQLIASNPTVIPAEEEPEVVEVHPATEEKTYDKFWMTHLTVIAQSPTEEAKLVATLVPARDVEIDIGDGQTQTIKELLPDAEPITIIVKNVFERSVVNPVFGGAMASVLNAVMSLGEEQGIIES